MTKWTIWFLFLTIGLSAQDMKFDSPSIDLKLTLDTGAYKLSVVAAISLDTRAHNEGDTLWFRLAANGYSSPEASKARELLSRCNTSLYFAGKRKFSSMSDLKITAGQKEVEPIFADESKEFIGIKINGQPREYNYLTFGYNLKIPEYVEGFGRSRKFVVLRYFYPQPAPFINGKWVLSPLWSMGHNLNHRLNIKAEITTGDAWSLSANGEQKSSVDIRKHYVSGTDISDLVLVFTAALLSETKGHIRFTDGREVPYTLIHKNGNKPDPALADKLINQYAAEMESLLGPYPYQSLKLVLLTELLDIQADNMSLLAVKKAKHFSAEVRKMIVGIWVNGSLKFSEKSDPLLSTWLKNYYVNSMPFQKPGYKISTANLRKQNYLKYIDLSNKNKLDSMSGISRNINRFEALKKPQFLLLTAGEKKFNTAVRQLAKNEIPIDIQTLTHQLDKLNEGNTYIGIDQFLKNSGYTNYSIKKAEKGNDAVSFTMENSEEGMSPFSLTLTSFQDRQKTIILEGFAGEKELNIANINLDTIKKIEIDRNGILYETDINNNIYYVTANTKLARKNNVVIGSNYDNDSGSIYILPLPIYNDNDRFMPSVLFTNTGKYSTNHLKYYLLPAYSFTNKKFVGEGRLSWENILPKGSVNRMVIDGGVKTYDFNRNEKWDYSQRYIRLDPGVSIIFRHSDGLTGSRLTARAFYIHEQYPEFTSQGNFEKLTGQWSRIYRVTYDHNHKTMFSSLRFFTSLEQQGYTALDKNQNYLKLTQSIRASWMYGYKKSIDVSIFAAGFITNTVRKSASYQNFFARGSIALIHQGFNDYTYDEVFVSRQNQNRFYDRQVSMVSGGGFKTPLGSASGLGMSNNWAAAINLTSDLPANLPSWMPLKLYFDVGTFSTYSTADEKFKNNFIFNGGILLNFYNRVTVHFPLVFSRDLGNAYSEGHNNILSKISFGINLNGHPF